MIEPIPDTANLGKALSSYRQYYEECDSGNSKTLEMARLQSRLCYLSRCLLDLVENPEQHEKVYYFYRSLDRILGEVSFLIRRYEEFYPEYEAILHILEDDDEAGELFSQKVPPFDKGSISEILNAYFVDQDETIDFFTVIEPFQVSEKHVKTSILYEVLEIAEDLDFFHQICVLFITEDDLDYQSVSQLLFTFDFNFKMHTLRHLLTLQLPVRNKTGIL